MDEKLLEIINSYKDVNDYETVKTEILKLGYNISGEGSGRIVFKINDELVLKVAKNDFGFQQNCKEYTKYQEFKTYPVINVTFDIFNNGYCISAEYLTPLTAEAFAKIYWVSFNYFKEFLKIDTKKLIIPKKCKQHTKDLITNTNEFFRKSGLNRKEILRPSQWGLTPDNNAKIIDYGK